MSPVYSEPVGLSLRAQLTGLLLPAISSERHTKQVSREISCSLFQGQLPRPKITHKISDPEAHLPLKASSPLHCNRARESLCRMKWRLKWMITGKPSIPQESLLWFCLCVQPEGKCPAMPMKHCFVLWTRQNKGLVMRSSRVSCKGQQQRQIPPWHFRSVAQSITNSGYSRIFHCLSKKCHLA